MNDTILDKASRIVNLHECYIDCFNAYIFEGRDKHYITFQGFNGFNPAKALLKIVLEEVIFYEQRVLFITNDIKVSDIIKILREMEPGINFSDIFDNTKLKVMNHKNFNEEFVQNSNYDLFAFDSPSPKVMESVISEAEKWPLDLRKRVVCTEMPTLDNMIKK